MKLRNGFVSNSSSSSFLIYGAATKLYNPALKLFKHIEKYGLEIIYDCDDIYIGRSWDTVKDDETGLQFKKSIEIGIKNLKEDFPEFKDQIGDIETISRSWYCG